MASAAAIPPYFAYNPAEPGLVQSYSDGNDPLGENEWEYAQLETYGWLTTIGNSYNLIPM